MNIKYKPSYYNLTVNESATTVHIWNVKRGSIVELEKPIFEKIELGCIDDAIVQYKDALVREGIIVPKDLDELQEILFCARQRQYSLGQNSFGLVITPTMACNYHCPYCFEQGVVRSVYMSKETQQTLIDALNEKLKGNTRVKYARVTWFGGEPLLAYNDVIVPLQSKIIDICEKSGVESTFSIITNGYFLTSDKYEFLFKNGRTKFIQITLDGSESDYIKRKGATAEAFCRVKNNILDLSDYAHNNNLDIKINVRLNADNENYSNIKTLVTELKEDKRFHGNIYFALERLREYDKCESINNYCNTEEFETLKYDFDDFVGKPPKFSEPKTVFCGQHCMNVFSIGVNGEIYKCEHDFGVPEHSIGNVKSGLNYNEYFLKFMDQPLPEKCLSCKILPVCMGGCPHRRLMNRNDVECDFTVKNLIKSAKKYILKKGDKLK